MKWYIATVLLCLSLLPLSPSFAQPLPISRDAFALGLPEGTGQDMERVEVMGDQNDFASGIYRLSFSVGQNKLTGRNLPPFKFRRECNFRRARGGSVGDYKPKSAVFRVLISDPYDRSTSAQLWSAGEVGQDYNENPLSREFDLNRRGTRIEPGVQALNMMRLRCLDRRPGPKTLFISFKSDGLCRWKPENWHKPGHFPFEYRPNLDASVQSIIFLDCRE